LLSDEPLWQSGAQRSRPMGWLLDLVHGRETVIYAEQLAIEPGRE
jgi:hypothetical protein